MSTASLQSAAGARMIGAPAISMWKKLVFGGSLVLGLGLFVFFIFKVGGIREAFAVLGQCGWKGIGIYLLLASLVLVAPAASWTILMRSEGMKVPYWTALKANFMGFPLNFIAPTMYLGSEPLKMLYVARLHGEPNRRVLATIIVGKFQEIGALLLVMIAASAISVWRIDFTRNQAVLIIVSMAVLTAIFGLALYGFLGNLQPTVKVINFIARFRKKSRKLAKLRASAREMEVLIHHAFTRRWKSFLLAQAVTLISAVSIIFRPWVLFYFAYGRWLPTEHLCAIYVLTNVINSLPHMPGGLGVFEGGMMGLFHLVLGLGKDDATAFSLLTRASDVLLILLGTFLIVHYGLQSLAKRVAKGEEKVDVRDAVGENGAPPPATSA